MILFLNALGKGSSARVGKKAFSGRPLGRIRRERKKENVNWLEVIDVTDMMKMMRGVIIQVVWVYSINWIEVRWLLITLRLYPGRFRGS